MDINQQKEQFSVAYLKAVASVSGLRVGKADVDDDSVDWTLAARGIGTVVRSPKLDLQLKCCSRDIVGDTHLSYQLDKKNYDDLRHENYLVPRVLVVVMVPDRVNEWLLHNETHLAIHHCGYWMSLRGMPDIGGQESKVIHVPRDQQFTVQKVNDLMQLIGSGSKP